MRSNPQRRTLVRGSPTHGRPWPAGWPCGLDTARMHIALGRLAVRLAVLVVASPVAACSSGGTPAPGPSPTSRTPAAVTSPSAAPAVRLGQPFTTGAFEVTVTAVEAATSLPLTADATAGGLRPYTPRDGQFFVVRLTARNIGSEPAAMSVTDSTITTGTGQDFSVGSMYTMLDGQGLGVTQQPATTASGLIVFDVPTSAGPPAVVQVAPDAHTQPVPVAVH